MEDDGIFRVLPEMIAEALGFKGLNLWQNEQKEKIRNKKCPIYVYIPNANW